VVPHGRNNRQSKNDATSISSLALREDRAAACARAFATTQEPRLIAFACVNDEQTLSTLDPYAVFRKMLDHGNLPDWGEALVRRHERTGRNRAASAERSSAPMRVQRLT
jgi:hypothetical protein